MAIEIVLADNHSIMREGLNNLIESQEGMKVVGEATSGPEAVELARELIPDIVIMDIMLPGFNGIEATSLKKP